MTTITILSTVDSTVEPIELYLRDFGARPQPDRSFSGHIVIDNFPKNKIEELKTPKFVDATIIHGNQKYYGCNLNFRPSVDNSLITVYFSAKSKA